MNNMTREQFQQIIEAAIFIASPIALAHLQKCFEPAPSYQEIKDAIRAIQEKYQQSGIELVEVASGFRFQAKTELSPWLAKLLEERPPRYSRAFLETLALIAYRQPITRAEIEEIRGVSASSNIIKTLLEHEWIKIIGQKDTPGKPALYATTKHFLDHFNLAHLDDLPTLPEIHNLENQAEKLQVQLELVSGTESSAPENAAPTLTITTEQTIILE